MLKINRIFSFTVPVFHPCTFPVYTGKQYKSRETKSLVLRLSGNVPYNLSMIFCHYWQFYLKHLQIYSIWWNQLKIYSLRLMFTISRYHHNNMSGRHQEPKKYYQHGSKLIFYRHDLLWHDCEIKMNMTSYIFASI